MDIYISNSSDKKDLADKLAASSSETDEATEEESAGSIYIDKNNNPDLSDAHIVTLSTCSYDSDVRFTVSAVRIDEHE